MVVGERVGTAINSSNPIPFEKQGVCIVENPKRKQIFFTHFTEDELENIQYAQKSKESLIDPFNWPRYREIRARDNLAIRFHSNTVIPWGEQLMNRQQSIDTMLTSRAELEYLEDKTADNIKLTHLVTMELLRRIKESLGSFGNWQNYQPKFLKR